MTGGLPSPQFPLRKTGEKTFSEQRSCIGRTLYKLSVDALCVVSICDDAACIKECGNRVLIAADRGGDFFVYIAVKDTAQKTLKAAVVEIDHFVHVRPP